MKNHFLIISIILLIAANCFSCSKEKNDENYASQSEPPAVAASGAKPSSKIALAEYSPSSNTTEAKAADLATQSDVKLQTRQLIKNAVIRFKVDDVDSVFAQINLLVKDFNGFVSGTERIVQGKMIENRITLRVPNDKFDTLVGLICNKATFLESKKIQSEDVTEQFVDAETRLKTKKDVLAKYIEILRGKAKTVDDIINAEAQISAIQEEIEALEGKLKFLKDRIEYSTINLQIYQTAKYIPKPDSYEKSFGDYISEAAEGGLSLIKWALIAFVYIWPGLLLLAIVLFIVFRKSKKKSN